MDEGEIEPEPGPSHEERGEEPEAAPAEHERDADSVVMPGFEPPVSAEVEGTEPSTLGPSVVMLVSNKNEKLLKIAPYSGWYKWAMCTTKNSRMNNCLLCSQSISIRLVT